MRVVNVRGLIKGKTDSNRDLLGNFVGCTDASANGITPVEFGDFGGGVVLKVIGKAFKGRPAGIGNVSRHSQRIVNVGNSERSLTWQHRVAVNC